MSRRSEELVIALVAPVGANMDDVCSSLQDRLENHFQYSTNLVRISSLLPQLVQQDDGGVSTEEDSESKRLNARMTQGNTVCQEAGDHAALATAAIAQIAHTRRENVPPENPAPLGRVAHIVRSLKRPEEVHRFRDIYGDGFFLLGIHAPEDVRAQYLYDRKGCTEDQIHELMTRDEEEDEDPYGQRTRDTFELSDAFIALPEFQDQLWRILDLAFGNPFVTPLRDEHAMFMAYAASLRSADLSRQVGAVVVSEHAEIVSAGANDVPCAGGGLYWADDPQEQRDHINKIDSNAKRRNEIVAKVLRNLGLIDPNEQRTADEIVQLYKDTLNKTGLLDITEFGRAVHAEMEAILACGRAGVSPRESTLYTTTFPCHNCAKHIIAAGIKRVVYVEPYPKSRALDLHSDAITHRVLPVRSEGEASGEYAGDPESPSDEGKVKFEPFVGVGPRRFVDLFSMRLGRGRTISRKDGANAIAWGREYAEVRTPMMPNSYIEREELALSDFNRLTKDLSDEQ